MSNPHPLGRRFLRAVYDGKKDLVLKLIEEGVPLSSTHHSGLQALHFAAKSGNVEIAEELLKRGASVNSVSLKGSTALHIASLLGKCDIVKLLLKNGANVNMLSKYNDESFTALYMAAQIGQQEIVTLLLAYGADPSIKTKNGSTAETVATQQGYHAIAQLLAEYESRLAANRSASSSNQPSEACGDAKDIAHDKRLRAATFRATEVKDTEGLRSDSEVETDTETIKQDTEGSELEDGGQANGMTSGDEDLGRRPRRGCKKTMAARFSGLKLKNSLQQGAGVNGKDDRYGASGDSNNSVVEKKQDSAKDVILNKIRANLSPVYTEAIPSPVNSPRRAPRQNSNGHQSDVQ